MCTTNHIKREVYEIGDIIPKIGNLFLINNNITIDLRHIKYYIFSIMGIKCMHCGVKGSFFRRERSPGKGNWYNNWHLNLYAVNKEGKEVLMTVDHVKPLSKGGTDSIDNMQILCYTCNQKKGDKL